VWHRERVSAEAPRRSATPPAAVRELATARQVRLAWENEDALTFEVGDGPDRCFVKWAPAGSPLDLAAEIADNGRWSGHVDLGDLGVADRWADLAVATWSTGWNYGPGWEQVLLDAYGIKPDAERTRYYRLLWELG
jgi:aminoglycoside phosphotransferase